MGQGDAGTKGFFCRDCGLKYEDRKSLERHRRDKHNDSNPIQFFDPLQRIDEAIKDGLGEIIDSIKKNSKINNEYDRLKDEIDNCRLDLEDMVKESQKDCRSQNYGDSHNQIKAPVRHYSDHIGDLERRVQVKKQKIRLEERQQLLKKIKDDLKRINGHIDFLSQRTTDRLQIAAINLDSLKTLADNTSRQVIEFENSIGVDYEEILVLDELIKTCQVMCTNINKGSHEWEDERSYKPAASPKHDEPGHRSVVSGQICKKCRMIKTKD